MIRYAFSEGVARLTFDSPATANAITYAMMQQYIDGLRQAQTDGARFLLITANGSDFTLGRDQKEKVEGVTREQSLTLILQANAALRAFEGVSIALIQGRALGFGSGIALHSTISVAADSATFGFDEIDHGLAPLVVLAYAPYYIAPRVAQELAITGRHVDAREAREIGIVSRVVPEQELAATGEALVEQLTGRLPAAVRFIRRYHEAQAAYPSDETLNDAVRQLAAWLAAGKP
ncbi:enoyl-CoA hydratase/isomerase family protein [Chitinasiproducens palmae]|uniref:Enoyl-CoA hydratase/carnithine racemase n=1 Tax=Chitinasiproducens palmae TaxID=1770053 RepID=A0A1H2PQ70_9BURK|nr:enoyl-CoA hydratase/isomerase family protein [Chitinasiproducens palmae]SDV48943.1 Enoyl-CoA hydratase/carnithine racemase [Chitinasiproducens palmae]